MFSSTNGVHLIKHYIKIATYKQYVPYLETDRNSFSFSAPKMTIFDGFGHFRFRPKMYLLFLFFFHFQPKMQ